MIRRFFMHEIHAYCYDLLYYTIFIQTLKWLTDK